ncbi:unnamed protein product [Lathyrus sativus]|nr:unnamed protein product [Lathyrus sativus]
MPLEEMELVQPIGTMRILKHRVTDCTGKQSHQSQLQTENLSSSKSHVEVFIGKKLQSEAIPVLEKIQKKKEKAMKQKERQDKLLKDFHNSYSSGNARLCRTRRPVNYSFEAYDYVIVPFNGSGF